ncbi:hypothetical protein CASFOL_014569 [Castilleja foliolosa]|uniref:Uncharacterized protein n=1 Tax=Castilleja foliolosa TaxID=1961234 RepID=A0ABD3DPG4_9LAMI
MKAASKWLEEEAAAFKSDDAKWPASKWLEEPEPEPCDEGKRKEADEGQAEGNPVKMKKTEEDVGDV